MSDFKIILKKSHHTFHFNQKTSLLTAIENQGFRPEYQCRNGYCGACRTKLISGKVSYPNPPLAFVNQNEVLLCYCQVEEDLELDL